MTDLPARAKWRLREKLTAYPVPPKTEDLLEPGVEAIPVRIMIQQAGFVTGWDDGAIGFEESRFWFSGRATSFHVSATDISSDHHDRRDLDSLTTGKLIHLGFPLRHPHREVSVRVAVLTVEDRHDWQDEETVAMQIRRLWRSNESDEPSQYPPLVPRPGATIWKPTPTLSTTDTALIPFFKGSLSTRLHALFGYGQTRIQHDPAALRRLLRAIAEDA